MQIKSIVVAGLLLITRCGRTPEVEPPAELSGLFSGQPQVVSTRSADWKLGVLAPRDEGTDFSVDEYWTSEAVHRWVIIPVVVQNSSGSRQSEDTAADLLHAAGVVGSDGNLYELSSESYVYWSDNYSPYAADESRQYLLMFDVPADVEPVQLLTDTWDSFQSVTVDL